MNHPNTIYMKMCIKEAKKCRELENYPIASLIVLNDRVLSIRSSLLPSKPDPTAHPEMIVIREAAEILNSRYLDGCYLYSTLEPCPMCTSAAIWAKVAGIVFGVTQEEAIKLSKGRENIRFTWRQIAIPASYVTARGAPKIQLFPNFMFKECLYLFKSV